MKQFLLSISLLLVLSYAASAQISSGNSSGVDLKIYTVNDVDPKPQYPGGRLMLIKYLSQVTYPAAAKRKGKEGVVKIGFVVELDGSIREVRILKSSGNDKMDLSAASHIERMPRWRVGKIYGKRVRTFYTLQVGFRLTDEERQALGAKGSDKKKG